LQAACALEPWNREHDLNLGVVCRRARRFADAVACFDRVLVELPGRADVRLTRGMALLALGRFAEGWADYESRWQTEPQIRGIRPWQTPDLVWQGEALGTGTLLLHAEQGFGDTLQFARYAPLLRARGLDVTLEVPPSLVRLISAQGWGPVIPQDVATPPPPFARHCPLMSLPRVLGTRLETIPAAVPYLRADPALTAAWRARLPAGRRRIGLVWAGQARQDSQLQIVDGRRSMALATLAPVLAQPDAAFVSLQLGPPAACAAGLPVLDVSAGLADWADTAALIASLDLVISVDTAVLHLAGALGKPVWMLDRYDACWRWLTDRTDSPWYPSLRIFRQPAPGDWTSVVASVAAALQAA
jgi:hypothetical protein